VVTRTVPGPTATVTAAPPAPVYLGLYGFTADGKAQFRVNDDPGYTVAVGAVFAKSFKFVQKTGVNPVCAKVLYGDVTTSVCDGEVKRMA
jgi:hypothetical protein